MKPMQGCVKKIKRNYKKNTMPIEKFCGERYKFEGSYRKIGETY